MSVLDEASLRVLQNDIRERLQQSKFRRKLSSQCGADKDSNFLEHNTMSTGKQLLTFGGACCLHLQVRSSTSKCCHRNAYCWENIL